MLHPWSGRQAWRPHLSRNAQLEAHPNCEEGDLACPVPRALMDAMQELSLLAALIVQKGDGAGPAGRSALYLDGEAGNGET